MSTPEFKTNVDKTAAEANRRQTESDEALLEDMVGFVGEIVQKVSPGIEDLDYLIGAMPSNAPLVSALKQTRQTVQHVLMPALAAAQAQLEALNAADVAPEEEAEP